MRPLAVRNLQRLSVLPDVPTLKEAGLAEVSNPLWFGLVAGIGILNKIRAYALQDEGADTVEANERLDLPVDSRDYRQCAEVLFDLDVQAASIARELGATLRRTESLNTSRTFVAMLESIVRDKM